MARAPYAPRLLLSAVPGNLIRKRRKRRARNWGPAMSCGMTLREACAREAPRPQASDRARREERKMLCLATPEGVRELGPASPAPGTRAGHPEPGI